MANKPSKFDHHTNNAHTCPHTHIYIYMYIYKVIKKNCKHLLSTMEFLTMLTLYSSYEGGGGGSGVHYPLLSTTANVIHYQ